MDAFIEWLKLIVVFHVFRFSCIQISILSTDVIDAEQNAQHTERVVRRQPEHDVTSSVPSGTDKGDDDDNSDKLGNLPRNNVPVTIDDNTLTLSASTVTEQKKNELNEPRIIDKSDVVIVTNENGETTTTNSEIVDSMETTANGLPPSTTTSEIPYVYSHSMHECPWARRRLFIYICVSLFWVDVFVDAH